MSLFSYTKFKSFRSLFKMLLKANDLKLYRNLSKFNVKNSFVFESKFKKAFNRIKEESPGRIVSSDIVLKTNKNKNDKSNQRKQLSSLQYRGELLYGIHPVYLALLKNRRKFNQLFIVSKVEDRDCENAKRKAEILDLALSSDIAVRNVDSKGLNYLLPEEVHQGVCLDVSPLHMHEWKEDITQVSPNTFPVWLVLDGILDPMNVGAIIRSAYYFGVQKIFSVRGNSCKMSPTVSKASSGVLEVMDIYQIENLEYFIKVMMSRNWKIISTAAFDNQTEREKLVNISDFQLKEPTVIILGNEGRGVSTSIQALCDSLLSIYPSHTLHKGIDSLNVSVATGVILFSLSSSWKNTLK